MNPPIPIHSSKFKYHNSAGHSDPELFRQRQLRRIGKNKLNQKGKKNV